MAGSLDSDGSIFISERGDPRVTFVASGNMGKQLCEDLQKAVGCGRLVTDQKVAKNTQKSIHRLIFSAKDDIRHVLKHSMPHMRLKDLQVTFTNWKDHQTKSESLLNKWGVDADTIGGYAEGL
jgi:ribosomal protein L17